MLSKKQQIVKRIFDLVLAVVLLLILMVPIVFFFILATMSSRNSGIFIQERIGQNARRFLIYKIRTMKGSETESIMSHINDNRVTKFGRFLRKYKLDELPQLINVIKGDMSFVGPRPDIPGYADQLKGDNSIILSVKPGLTGPATIKFLNEEVLLEDQHDPRQYNDEVLWREKVLINKKYINNWTFFGDVRYIFDTLIQLFVR